MIKNKIAKLMLKLHINKMIKSFLVLGAVSVGFYIYAEDVKPKAILPEIKAEEKVEKIEVKTPILPVLPGKPLNLAPSETKVKADDLFKEPAKALEIDLPVLKPMKVEKIEKVKVPENQNTLKLQVLETSAKENQNQNQNQNSIKPEEIKKDVKNIEPKVSLKAMPVIKTVENNPVLDEISFKQESLLDALRGLANQAGVSFVAPDISDKETITCTLYGKTPLEAFEIIARLKGYRVVVSEGITTITRPDLALPEELKWVRYKVDYINPEWVVQDVANLLGIEIKSPKDFIASMPTPEESSGGNSGSNGGSSVSLSVTTGGSGNSASSGGNQNAGIPETPRWKAAAPFDAPLSSGGFRETESVAKTGGGVSIKSKSAIFINTREGAIVVRGSVSEHEIVAKYIAEIDVPQSQIMISTQIVEVDIKEGMDSGVDWSKALGTGLDLKLRGGTTAATSPGSTTGTTGTSGSTATDFIYKLISANSSFPGAVLSMGEVQATFRYFKENGTGSFLSRPDVITMNGVPTVIRSTLKESIRRPTTPTTTGSSTAGSGTTVSNNGLDTFTTGVFLDVVPRILKGGVVNLNIKPTVSSAPGRTSDGIPLISERTATTTVNVKSGNTVVIGGLMQLSDNKNGTGLDPLDKLGGPFGEKKRESRRTNLLIFVTPYIIPADKQLEPTIGAEEANILSRGIEQGTTFKQVPIRPQAIPTEAFNPNKTSLKNSIPGTIKKK